MSPEATHVGTVAAVMILEPGAQIVSTRQGTVQVSRAGFEGDRHAGLTRPATGRDEGAERGTPLPNLRQVSLVSEEELAQVADALDVEVLRPEWLGSNLSLRGIPDLTRLPEGARLRFEHGVELTITGENMPCSSPGRELQSHFPNAADLESRFPKAALGRRGLVARIESPGQISVGDRVELSGVT